LNVARGTGLAGLAGIPERRDNIVRPLLPFSRDETRIYCDERGFWYHDDPANADITFSRARVRHRILPEMRSINQGADAAIARLADLASEEDRFLSGMAAAALEQSERPLNGELQFLTMDVEACFDRAKLLTLPPVLFKRATRLAGAALGGVFDYDQTNAILNGVVAEERGSITGEGGLVVAEWDSDDISFRHIAPTAPFRHPLTVPGETTSDEFGWRFAVQEGVADRPKRAQLTTAMAPKGIKGQLYFRPAQAGDEMRPLGFDGRRKLSDLLAEAGLTRAARARLPIVCDLVGPVWAPGVCVDGRVAPEMSQQGLLLEFGPIC
jgi:tRNA(Ile)-lysidine synthase